MFAFEQFAQPQLQTSMPIVYKIQMMENGKLYFILFFFTAWIPGTSQCLYHHIQDSTPFLTMPVALYAADLGFQHTHASSFCPFTSSEMLSSSWNDILVIRTISNCAKVCLTSHKIALPWFSSEHQFSPLGKLGLCQSAPDVADELECISDNLRFLPGDSPIRPMFAYFVIQAGDFAVHCHWRFYYL